MVSDDPNASGIIGTASSEPHPTPESLLAHARLLADADRWKEALAVAEDILRGWPHDSGANGLRDEARQAIARHDKLQQAFARARQSGKLTDWLECLEMALALRHEISGPARDDLGKLIGRCQAEITYASRVVRAESLIRAERFVEAASCIADIPDDCAAAYDCRTNLARIAAADQLVAEALQRANDFVQQGDWLSAQRAANAGAILAGSAAQFRPIWNQASLQRAADVQTMRDTDAAWLAAEAGDWDKAENLAGEIQRARPENPVARSHHAWIERAHRAQGLLDDYQWSAALALIEDIPVDIAPANALRAKGEGQRFLSEQLQRVVHTGDVEGASAIVERLPLDHPQRSEILTWIADEKENRARMSAVLSEYEIDTPPGFPLQDAAHLVAWQKNEIEYRARHRLCRLVQQEARRRAQAALVPLVRVEATRRTQTALLQAGGMEAGRRARIAAALRAYDGDALLAALADAPDGYPRLQELREWAQRESARATRIVSALIAYDGDALLDALADAPDGYPERDELRAWGQRESERRKRINAALMAYDGEALLAALQSAPDDYPEKKSLVRRAKLLSARRRKINTALRTRNGDSLLHALAGAPADYPQRDELRARGDFEKVRTAHIDAGLRDYNTNAIRSERDRMDATHPRYKRLERWLQRETKREDSIRAALVRYDWPALQAIIAVTPLNHPRRDRWRQMEQDARFWREQIEDAYRKKEWDRLLDLLDKAPSKYPNRARLRQQVQCARIRQNGMAVIRRLLPLAIALMLFVLLGLLALLPTCGPKPTPTPTPTPGSSRTVTQAATFTPMPTDVPVSTPTAMPTQTVANTATRTATREAASTWTRTPTALVTPSNTATTAPTPTQTRTFTPTRTLTPAPTNTPVTPTNTRVTPTNTRVTPTNAPVWIREADSVEDFHIQGNTIPWKYFFTPCSGCTLGSMSEMPEAITNGCRQPAGQGVKFCSDRAVVTSYDVFLQWKGPQDGGRYMIQWEWSQPQGLGRVELLYQPSQGPAPVEPYFSSHVVLDNVQAWATQTFRIQSVNGSEREVQIHVRVLRWVP